MHPLMRNLYILAVALFLGNIITGLFWKAHGDRTRDPRIMAHTIAGIIRCDRWFTLPGVALSVAFGIGAAMAAGVPFLRTAWIWESILLFVVSGLAFVLEVAPLQVRLRALADTGASGGTWYQGEYYQLSHRWEFWRAVVIVTPLAGLLLTVFKLGS